MAELKMPRRGGAAAMLQELNAEEAPAVNASQSSSNYLASKIVSQKDRELDEELDSKTDDSLDSELTSQKDRKTERQKDNSLTGKIGHSPMRTSRAVRKSGEKKGGEAADFSANAPGTKSAKRIAGENVAENLGNGPMIAVGIKMPEDLNDYLNAAAFARRKQKVLKQDLIRRAIQLLVVELESGEELADLNS